MTINNIKNLNPLYFFNFQLLRKCAVLLIIVLISHQQIMGQQFLNLYFESEDKDTRLPKNWYIVEEQYCDFYSDHRITFNKNTSLLLSPKKYSNNCKAVLLNQLNHQLFKGKKQIKVIAYVRFKSVSNSQVLVISKQLSIQGKPIENIPHSELIKSTENKWYKITLIQDISPNTEYMAFGIQASLSDSAWIDNFEIYFDTNKVIESEPTIVKGPAKTEIDWLDNNVIPIRITDSIENVEDLKLFHKYINQYRIVALGEVTHGSSEIYEFKKRVLQFLFNNCDFTILAMEMDMAEGRLINKYLLTSEGDLEKIISQTTVKLSII